jgi:uncharacterized cupin superfamily protein
MLKQSLGNDVILWGARVVKRSPGREHRWHTDIESAFGDGFLSVWIGLENTQRDSALSLVPGSHRFGKPVQQVACEHGVKRDSITEAATLSWAREHDPDAKVVQPEMADGEALLFDGRLWHGSQNRTDAVRSALLLQYASADQNVLIPDLDQLEWPFRYKKKSAPSVIVSGDAGRSPARLVPLPLPDRNSVRDVPIVCRPLVFPLLDDPERGWRPHKILRGATPNAGLMSAHISVLNPGRSPHPPHVHVEEEVLIVLDGEAEILIGDNPDPAAARVERVPAGAFSYYPAYQHHTIRNAGAANVTYLMFKWRAPPLETTDQAKAGIFRFSDILTEPPAKSFQTKKFFEQPTGYLTRLHAHISTVAPGGGYAPHADKHDVAIVVLSGEVEAAGTVLRRHGVFYFPAGRKHGMKNIGKVPARYLVFEFHAPAPDFTPNRFARNDSASRRGAAHRWVSGLRRLLPRRFGSETNR